MVGTCLTVIIMAGEAPSIRDAQSMCIAHCAGPLHPTWPTNIIVLVLAYGTYGAHASTLLHNCVHAMQDDSFDLTSLSSAETMAPATQLACLHTCTLQLFELHHLNTITQKALQPPAAPRSTISCHQHTQIVLPHEPLYSSMSTALIAFLTSCFNRMSNPPRAYSSGAGFHLPSLPTAPSFSARVSRSLHTRCARAATSLEL